MHMWSSFTCANTGLLQSESEVKWQHFEPFQVIFWWWKNIRRSM